MAHEIDETTGKAAMMYAGEVPWHGLGTQVEEAVTSQEAIVTAGLDWEVKMGNLYGPRKNSVEGLRAIYRDDTGAVLGIATPQYHTFQNAEAFQFLDSLVKDRVVHYETAGAIKGGKEVWMLASLDKDIEVAGEQLKPYMLLTASHDARQAIRLLPTAVRVVCANTLQMALRGGHVLRILHKPNLAARLEEAKNVLEITTEASRRLESLLNKAAATPITKTQLEKVQTSLFGSLDDDTPALRRKAIEKFQAIYAEEATHNDETVYTTINAITGYADHARRYKGDSVKRAESRFFATTNAHGASFRMKNNGLTAILSAVPDFAKEVKEEIAGLA